MTLTPHERLALVRIEQELVRADPRFARRFAKLFQRGLRSQYRGRRRRRRLAS